MAERATKPAGKDAADKADTSPGAVASGQVHGPADAPGPGSAEVQAAMDVATEQGFYGVEVDQTPNEHYTVDGVLAGKPTPETDADAFDAASGAAVRNPHRR